MRSRPQVVDVETGEALGPGQDGEICVKGPTVMKGINPAVIQGNVLPHNEQFPSLFNSKKPCSLKRKQFVLHYLMCHSTCIRPISINKKFIPGSEAWGNVTKEIILRLSSEQYISFILLPQASHNSSLFITLRPNMYSM